MPFTSLWQHDAQTDSWAGFSSEKQSILSVLHTIPNVVILSGDRHEFAAIEFNGPAGWTHSLIEFSTSPISMFYVPFIRTLAMESAEYAVKLEHHSQIGENGTEEMTTKTVVVPEERVISYKPDGNYKWYVDENSDISELHSLCRSSFEVDTRNPAKPVVRVEVMVDGRPAYRYEHAGLSASRSHLFLIA